MPDEFTDAARARIALSAAARDLADAALGLVPTEDESTHHSVQGLIERVDQLAAAVDELRRLAVIHGRERYLSWEDVGAALGVTRQTAHERFAKVVDEWRDNLYDPARHTYSWMPAGAYNPSETVSRLQSWLARHDTERGEPRGVAAGLPAYTPIQRTNETLGRANWLSVRLRQGLPISPEAEADHHRRKDIATTDAMAELERLRAGD